eukprot:1159431-Pelagomonas_calceolata.AAC.2
MASPLFCYTVPGWHSFPGKEETFYSYRHLDYLKIRLLFTVLMSHLLGMSINITGHLPFFPAYQGQSSQKQHNRQSGTSNPCQLSTFPGVSQSKLPSQLSNCSEDHRSRTSMATKPAQTGVQQPKRWSSA